MRRMRPGACPALLRRLRRRADTTYLMLAATITGVLGLIVPGAKSLAISNSLSGLIEVVWFAGVALGGAGGLASILVGGRAGLIMERPVRWLLAFLCSAFGIAVAYYVGVTGIAGMAFIGLFGVACLFAAWDIRVRLAEQPVEERLRNELASVQNDLKALREEFPAEYVSRET